MTSRSRPFIAPSISASAFSTRLRTMAPGIRKKSFGRAIGNRDDIVIATKFGFATDEKTKQATGAFADPAFIRQSAETSLRRLKRERLDLLQFHLNDFPLEASDEVFDALEALKAQGKIDAFGWSTDFPDRAARHAGCKGFVSIQHTMNVFEPVPAMVDVVEKNGLLSINRGPLAMGLLSGKFTAGEDSRRQGCPRHEPRLDGLFQGWAHRAGIRSPPGSRSRPADHRRPHADTRRSCVVMGTLAAHAAHSRFSHSRPG